MDRLRCTRPLPDEFAGTRASSRSEVADSGEVQLLHASAQGACCGVATYAPTEPIVAFIIGPEHPGPEWSYSRTRRRGALVDAREPGQARPLDAMNYAPPFQPGALRGVSHVHVFSPDGAWVSFTYEDEVLARLGPASAGLHDLNQRNLGVAVPRRPGAGGAHPSAEQRRETILRRGHAHHRPAPPGFRTRSAAPLRKGGSASTATRGPSSARGSARARLPGAGDRRERPRACRGLRGRPAG